MSSLKDVLTGRLRVPPTTGTLAHGITPPRSSILDHVVKRDPSYTETLSYQEVYDIFGVEHGDSFALVQRLLRDRWPGITITKTQAKPPARKGPTVAQRVLLIEIDAIKAGCQTTIEQLRASGSTIDQIATKTRVTRKQVNAITDGREMTDEAAADIYLTWHGSPKRGHTKEYIARARQKMKTRISRARKAMKSAAE
jgi:hypothetical protein